MTTPPGSQQPTPAEPPLGGHAQPGFGPPSSSQSQPPQMPGAPHLGAQNFGAPIGAGPFPQPPRKPNNRGIIFGTIAGIVVIALIATGVFFLTRDEDKPDKPPSNTSSSGKLQKLEEIARINYEVKSKEEGPPSAPDPEAMALTATTAYVAYNTSVGSHLTAIDLESGKELWKKEITANSRGVMGIDIKAHQDALLVEVTLSRGYQSYALDLETGEQFWELGAPLQCDSDCTFANRLVVYDPEADLNRALDVATGKEKWSVPEDPSQPSYTMFPQYSWNAKERGIDLNSNKDTYIGHGQKATGQTEVLKASDGTKVSEGNVGENVTDYVLFGKTLYVFRNTPNEVAAYSVDDLSKPLWRTSTPAGEDGSSLGACGEKLLCLKIASGGSTLVRAIETKDGTTRWETSDYQTSDYLPATPVGDTIVLELQNGSVLLDPETGEKIEMFDQIGNRAGEEILISLAAKKDNLYTVEAYDTGKKQATSLGSLPSNECIVNEAFFVCAEEDDYSVWRYRSNK